MSREESSLIGKLHKAIHDGILLTDYIPLFGEDYIIAVYWHGMKIEEIPMMVRLEFNVKEFAESGEAAFSVAIVKFDRQPPLEAFEREDFPSLPVSECTFRVPASIKELSSIIRDKIVECEGREFRLYDWFEMFDLFGALDDFYKPFVLFPAFVPYSLYEYELFVDWLLCILSMVEF